MTAVPEAPSPPGRANRVVADLAGDVASRLRTWAALRGQPVSHVVSEVVTAAVPTTDQLRELVGQIGSTQ